MNDDFISHIKSLSEHEKLDLARNCNIILSILSNKNPEFSKLLSEIIQTITQ